jgi:hypothetical protein
MINHLTISKIQKISLDGEQLTSRSRSAAAATASRNRHQKIGDVFVGQCRREQVGPVGLLRRKRKMWFRFDDAQLYFVCSCFEIVQTQYQTKLVLKILFYLNLNTCGFGQSSDFIAL